MNERAKVDRNRGVLIALAASLVLILLAAYKIPIIHSEFYGYIKGVSEVHDETGSKLIAAVHLDTEGQVLASMPNDLQIRTDVKVKVMEGRSILGRKSYRVISYSE